MANPLFIAQAIASGAAALASPLDLTGSSDRNVGGITFDVTIEERHRDEVVITQHPVEQSAPINDHAYLLPNEVIIRVGSSLSGIAAATDPLALRELYDLLLDLKASFEPFSVVTGKRDYDNMLIRILEVTTDEHSENIIRITMWLRQVILVSTQTTSLSSGGSPANMAIPQKTAPALNFGSKFPTLATPTLPGVT